MKRFIFLLLVAWLLPFMTMGQNANPGDIKTTEIKPFVVLERSDEVNYYFQVDFSLFADRFEKIYFLQLIFQDHRIVNTDGDLTKDMVGFQASRKHDKEEIMELFKAYKTKVSEESSEMDDASKIAWLHKNDKY